MGRVLLAAQSGEWLSGYLASTRLRPLTSRTITDPDMLLRELRRVRDQGWALVDQELEDGLRSVAAPLRNAQGTVVAAINVSAPVQRGPADKVRSDLLPHLLRTAARIEEDLRSVSR